MKKSSETNFESSGQLQISSSNPKLIVNIDSSSKYDLATSAFVYNFLLCPFTIATKIIQIHPETIPNYKPYIIPLKNHFLCVMMSEKEI